MMHAMFTHRNTMSVELILANSKRGLTLLPETDVKQVLCKVWELTLKYCIFVNTSRTDRHPRAAAHSLHFKQLLLHAINITFRQ